MSSEDEDQQSIVIDNGAYKVLAGFGGDCKVRCVMYCLTGKSPSNDIYFGYEALNKRNELDVKCPMQRGVVIDWDGMEKIWNYMFYDELRVKSTSDYQVLLTEAPLNPKSHREKMAEIMFEKFNIPALYITNPAVLSLYSSGRVEGTVFDCGEEVSCALSAVELSDKSFTCLDSVERQDVAGRDVANYMLSELLTQRGDLPVDYYTARQIVEKCCYVCVDLPTELAACKDSIKSYQLPDGKVIDLGKECFVCPEALFRPHTTPLDLSYGIHEMVNRSIARSVQQNEALQKTLYSNIVLAGGGNMLRGTAERMQQEIRTIAPSGVDVKVVAPPERRSSSWLGGSIVASLSLYQKVCTNKKEYEEYGPAAIHRKST